MKKFGTITFILFWCCTVAARKIRFFDLPTPLRNLTGRHRKIFVGDSIILTCRFSEEVGSKAMLFYWQTKLVEVSLNESTPYPDHYRITFDHTRYDLEVMKADRRHTGVYFCTISRERWGVTHLEGWALEVIPVPKAELVIQPQNLEIEEFTRRNKINCTSRAIKPLPDLQWYRKIGEEWRSILTVSDESRNLDTATSSSTLLFDASNHDEVFLCVAKGQDDQSLSRKVTVRVHRASNNHEYPTTNVPLWWMADPMMSEDQIPVMTTDRPNTMTEDVQIVHINTEKIDMMETTKNSTESGGIIEGEDDKNGPFSKETEYSDEFSGTFCILIGGAVVVVLVCSPLIVVTFWAWNVGTRINSMIFAQVGPPIPVAV